MFRGVVEGQGVYNSDRFIKLANDTKYILDMVDAFFPDVDISPLCKDDLRTFSGQVLAENGSDWAWRSKHKVLLYH